MSPTVSLSLLAAAFFLTLANGFFVAAEFGLVTVEWAEAERAAADGDRRARTVVEALRGLSFQLSGTQLGITITSLVLGMLAEPALGHLLTGPLTATWAPAGAVPGLAVAVGMLVASAVQMVIGELVPKNWAVSRPLQVDRFVAGLQHAFARFFRPLISLLNTVANRLVRAFGVEPTEELASARTPGELVSLARHSARAGAIEQDTVDLFVRTLSLAGLTAQHVITPRVRVSALQATATAQDVLNLTRATGLSRFPVYRDRLDEVVGMVHLKDALAIPAAHRLHTPVDAIAQVPLLVPMTLPVQPLLRQLRDQPIAVVVDEYGGTAGVITLEDILEELVGEVRDEHDTADQPELVQVAGDDGYLVWEAGGGCRLDTLARIGLVVPEGPYETAAGLVAGLLASRCPVTSPSFPAAGGSRSARSATTGPSGSASYGPRPGGGRTGRHAGPAGRAEPRAVRGRAARRRPAVAGASTRERAAGVRTPVGGGAGR